MSIARRRAEPGSANIFADRRRGASSLPCSHHLIPCRKYREFHPNPIDSAALYVATLREKSHFLGKSLLFSLIPGIFGVADRFPKTTSTTSQSPRTGKTTAGLKKSDSSAGWRDEVGSPMAFRRSPRPTSPLFRPKSLGAKFRFPGCSWRGLDEMRVFAEKKPALGSRSRDVQRSSRLASLSDQARAGVFRPSAAH
jgi:hypothetical protein